MLHLMHLNPLAIELNSWCSLLNYSFKRQERKKREGKRKRKKERKNKGESKKTVGLGKCLCNWLMHMLLYVAPKGSMCFQKVVH